MVRSTPPRLRTGSAAAGARQDERARSVARAGARRRAFVAFVAAVAAAARQPTRSASSLSIPTWRRALHRPPPASEVARETSSAGAGAAPRTGARGCEPGRTRQRAAAAAAAHGPCRQAPPRPAPAHSVVEAAPRAAEPDNRSIFEKIFGSPKPETTVVAYANPESPPPRVSALNSANGAPGRYDKYTAVYDISAHTVYLPSGAKLEAHSGLGDLIDDPHHVDVRAKGATPPDVYELSLREKPFYGIQALRMKPSRRRRPASGAPACSRTLTCSGRTATSFGCVSFKDYEAFLQAYQSGEVKRLAVVARLQ